MYTRLNKQVLVIIMTSIIASILSVQAQSNEPNLLAKAKAHFQRARSYDAERDPRAEEEYRLAIATRRAFYPEAWELFSYYLARKLRFAEAADALRTYLKQIRQKPHPTDLERLRLLGRGAELKHRNDRGEILPSEEMVALVHLVDQFGEPGDALPYAEKAVKSHPESAKALVALAELIGSENKDRALDLLNRAVMLEPNEASVYTARGWCYYRSYRNWVDAEADFRRAIELSRGSSPSAWLGLGDSLAQTGNRKEAIDAYRKYLKIRPKTAAHHDGVVEQAIQRLQTSIPS
jgi:tetratricopeptide (TPR) repeat protein